MSEDLRLWLTKEIDQRGLSHNELARRSGLAQSTISSVLAGNKNPGCDFCVKIATALDVNPVYVLKLAGHLPATAAPASPGPVTAEILQIIENLTYEQRQQVLAFVRFLGSQPGKNPE